MKKAAIAGLLLLAGAAALWHWGRPVWRQQKETRFIAQAREFLAKDDYANASLTLRETLQIQPNNLEACQLTAQLAERTRSPHALDWRQKVADLSPTIENKLLLARTALNSQSSPYPLAAQVLADLKEPARDRAAYHVLAAELALKLQKTSEAAIEFNEASRLEPTNELHRLNLAVLRLQSTNANLAAEARSTLERLSANPGSAGVPAGESLSAIALRWLVADGLRRNALGDAEGFSARLLASPHSIPEDRLQELTILHNTDNPRFRSYLESTEAASQTNAVEAHALAMWLTHNGLSDEALRWLTNCPVKLQNQQPVPLARVEAHIAKKDWPSLEGFLEDQKWGDLEFLRAAFLSRAASEQKQELASDAHWRAAVRQSWDSLGRLAALLNLATSWGRVDAREDVLWRIGQRFPRERWALTELEGIYSARHDTRGLYKVYSTRLEYEPSNLVTRNNLAATSLLLNLNLAQAHDLARQDHLQQPDDPVIASTYAYSLHLQGRTRDGLAELEKLKPTDLEKPSIALYYGLLLAAVGQNEKADKYLNLARAADLFPEEKTLLASAGQK